MQPSRACKGQVDFVEPSDEINTEKEDNSKEHEEVEVVKEINVIKNVEVVNESEARSADNCINLMNNGKERQTLAKDEEKEEKKEEQKEISEEEGAKEVYPIAAIIQTKPTNETSQFR